MHEEPASKQRILQAAKRQFARQGFDATSLRQICTDAGVNTALISYHYGGKEQLFNAIYEQYYLPERYEHIFEVLNNPHTAMEAFIELMIKYRFEEPDLMAITYQELAMNSSRSHFIKQFLQPAWNLMKQIVTKGQERSMFYCPSLDYALTSIMGTLLYPPQISSIQPLMEKEVSYEDMLEYVTVYVFRILGSKLQDNR
ncbi:TetR/AcrR family transcriptional regulator [Paenibacillus sp. FSL R10-2782]|uniref:TetR/AcrR family transcriptional regulator n=1 Tax=Paenibacillus sp. FSL R10-2782 TaxID=2954661 RepID=UPI003158A0BD